MKKLYEYVLPDDQSDAPAHGDDEEHDEAWVAIDCSSGQRVLRVPAEEDEIDGENLPTNQVLRQAIENRGGVYRGTADVRYEIIGDALDPAHRHRPWHC